MQTLNGYILENNSKPRKGIVAELENELRSSNQRAEVLSAENERLR